MSVHYLITCIPCEQSKQKHRYNEVSIGGAGGTIESAWATIDIPVHPCMHVRTRTYTQSNKITFRYHALTQTRNEKARRVIFSPAELAINI